MKDSGEWYVINTYTGKEKKVKQLIENMDFADIEVCNLGRIVSEKKKNVIRTKIKPVFPGYIFIRGNLDVIKYIYIKRLDDVIGFVSDGAEPLSITEPNIIKLLNLSTNFPYNILPESRVSIGENGIKIIEGPLMGCESMILKTALRRGRIYMNLSLFGRNHTVAMPAMMAAN